MGSGSAPESDPAGSTRLLVGGLAIIGSLFLLVPGINQSSAMVYRNEDGDPLVITLLLAVGGALFLTGSVLAVAGLFRRRAHKKRVVTYGDLDKADHEIDEPYLGQGQRTTPGRLERRLRRRNRYRSR